MSTCPTCGSAQPPRARFCGHCGARLAEVGTARGEATQRPGRVWLAVAFAVLVGVVGAALVTSGNFGPLPERADRSQVVLPSDAERPSSGVLATPSDSAPDAVVDPGLPPTTQASVSVLDEPADEDDVMPSSVAERLGVSDAEASNARLVRVTPEPKVWVFEREDDSGQRLVCVAIVAPSGITACGEPIAGPDGVIVAGSDADGTMVALVTDGVSHLPAGTLTSTDLPVVRNVAVAIR